MRITYEATATPGIPVRVNSLLKVEGSFVERSTIGCANRPPSQVRAEGRFVDFNAILDVGSIKSLWRPFRHSKGRADRDKGCCDDDEKGVYGMHLEGANKLISRSIGEWIMVEVEFK